jgi:hypothetical protein
MSRVIFYAWQSDLPNSTNRSFIQRALDLVAKALASDSTAEDVPIIDRDTQGVPGAPNIAKTILEKIAGADVVVADVSIIGGQQAGRPTPNPNVLVEVGYALCSLGEKRLVLVLNSAYGAPEDLPFDLKMHRVMSYRMLESDTDRATERSALESKLKAAIKAALASDKRIEELRHRVAELEAAEPRIEIAAFDNSQKLIGDLAGCGKTGLVYALTFSVCFFRLETESGSDPLSGGISQPLFRGYKCLLAPSRRE